MKRRRRTRRKKRERDRQSAMAGVRVNALFLTEPRGPPAKDNTPKQRSLASLIRSGGGGSGGFPLFTPVATIILTTRLLLTPPAGGVAFHRARFNRTIGCITRELFRARVSRSFARRIFVTTFLGKRECIYVLRRREQNSCCESFAYIVTSLV